MMPRFDLMRFSVDMNRAKYANDKKFIGAVKRSYHGRDPYYAEHAINYANTLLNKD
jgi:hypothetical protein